MIIIIIISCEIYPSPVTTVSLEHTLYECDGDLLRSEVKMARLSPPLWGNSLWNTSAFDQPNSMHNFLCQWMKSVNINRRRTFLLSLSFILSTGLRWPRLLHRICFAMQTVVYPYIITSANIFSYGWIYIRHPGQCLHMDSGLFTICDTSTF